MTTLTEEYTTGDKTRAGEIAKVEDGKDVILMTGDGAEPIIEDNVSDILKLYLVIRIAQNFL